MKYISYLLLALASLPAFAQYDQDIAVEGKYVPEYINHDRIGIFPKPIKFSLEKSTLEYSLGGTNADFTPLAVPIQATGWKSTRDFSTHRGYLEIGTGSWLGTTLSAGYRFIDTRSSSLGVRIQHNSTSLWKPAICEMLDTRRERYDEVIGFYGSHTFGDAGRLDAAVDYHFGYFNYYGFNPLGTPLGDKYPSAPTQTLNDVSARVTWQSPAVADNISWNAGAGVRYFGFRRYYFYAGPQVDNASMTGIRETDTYINGGLKFPTSAKSSLGLNLDAHLLTYGKPEWRNVTDTYQVSPLPTLDNCGIISLTPYYKFTRSRLNILLGARIDLSFNAGPENDRFGLFHIAPNVKLDYDAGPLKLFLYALGGSSAHTEVGGYENNYYTGTAITNTTPVYTPLDAQLGLTFGPFAGFHAGFDIAFRITRGQYLGGMYQLYINSLDGTNLGFDLNLPDVIDNRPVYYSLGGGRYNLTGFSFGLNAGYDAGRFFKISAAARYQHQNGNTGYFNGYDRPELIASLSAETNPWKSLKFKLGYDLRALRKLPVRGYYSDTTPLNGDFLVNYRIPNLSQLNFGASYAFSSNINVWLQADNLLNRRSYYMAGLPEPGIQFYVGAGFYF